MAIIKKGKSAIDQSEYFKMQNNVTTFLGYYIVHKMSRSLYLIDFTHLPFYIKHHTAMFDAVFM